MGYAILLIVELDIMYVAYKYIQIAMIMWPITLKTWVEFSPSVFLLSPVFEDFL